MTPGFFRLFLASCVVVHHSFPLRLGGWAVGMFFVLSGFWVTRMWRTSYSHGTHRLSRFYASRWIRLAPLFICAQLFAFGLWWATSVSGTPPPFQRASWWVTQFTVLGSTQFGKLLPPAWSLDVEAQFYGIAPLLVTFMASSLCGTTAGDLNSRKHTNFTPLWIGVILIGMVWSFSQLLKGVSMETPRLDLYLWLFLVGMLCEVRDWMPLPRLEWMGIVLFLTITGLFLVNPATRSAIWISGSSGERNPTAELTYYFLATIVSVPVAIATVHRKSNQIDMWLGDLSYPLYLFHWFPRDWYYTHFDLSRGFARNIPLLFANFAMAYGLAVMMLQFVDRPIQRWRKKWLKSKNAKQSS